MIEQHPCDMIDADAMRKASDGRRRKDPVCHSGLSYEMQSLELLCIDPPQRLFGNWNVSPYVVVDNLHFWFGTVLYFFFVNPQIIFIQLLFYIFLHKNNDSNNTSSSTSSSTSI